MLQTFPGGKHIHGFKDFSKDKQIVSLPLPSQVIIPLSQHTGKNSQLIVKQGDKVKTGQKIGESTGFISSCIHSSISGTVSKIAEYNHPVIGRCQSVVVDSDGNDELDSSIKSRQNVESLSNDKLREIVKETGIVGLGGAAFPTHVKLSPPKQIDTLIINGVECEPYLTCDFRLMLEKTKDILRGVLILKKILQTEAVYIGIEEDKPEAIRAMRNKIVQMKLPITVVPLKAKYPQGAEKQLIKAIVDREVPAGKLPLDVGVVVSNVGTVLAVYEAIYDGKPLYERVVTVTGKIVKEPANLRVRVGTKFSELIAYCGGTTQVPAKIIMGGPMMGLAQCSEDVPVIKGTSGILIFSEDELEKKNEQPCIRCGRCIDVCPMNMLPYALSICGENERFERASKYTPFDCMECGACTYVCPAQRRIVEYIRLIKAVLK
ncbi:MAG: electron transport complex subunit RsxC [PVC group bacterium]|nr:electron transport complex subunit RsxC [PVC group bacterium]